MGNFVLLFIFYVLCPADATPPIFTAPPSPLSVAESETNQVLIYTLTAVDPNFEQVVCSIEASDPNTTFFGIWPDSSDFALYLRSRSTLSYSSTPSYVLTLTCANDIDFVSHNVTINVQPNVAPSFSNLPATRSTLNANSADMGDVIYTVTGTDSDSDFLTYSMTSIPTSPDLFYIDEISGEVIASQDISHAVDSAYDLTITVSDSIANTTSNLYIPISTIIPLTSEPNRVARKHSEVECWNVQPPNVYGVARIIQTSLEFHQSLTTLNPLHFPDYHTDPIITNLPSTIYVQETAAKNEVIFTLSITSSAATTVTFVVSPSDYTEKFKMDNNDVEITNSNNRLNYEDQNEFNITFYVSDGIGSTGGYVLTVYVLDVNENCDFDFNNYWLTMYEANAGGGTIDPRFFVWDPDFGSNFTFSRQGIQNASYFYVDPNNGQISFDVNYDVDVTHLDYMKFNVYCADDFGTSSPATLYITIEDVNDNAPTFGTSYILLFFDQLMPIPTNITTLTATDVDTGINAQLHFSWTTTGVGGNYFTLNPNGMIMLTKDPQPSVSFGTIFTFTVIATDRGTPALSGTTLLDLVYYEVNATTPLTTTVIYNGAGSDGDSFGDKPSNIIALVLGLLLAGTLTAGGVYLTWKYMGKMQTLFPQAKKVKPQPKLVDVQSVASDRHSWGSDPEPWQSEQQSWRSERQTMYEGRQLSPSSVRPTFDFWSNNEFQSLSTAVSRDVGYSDFPSSIRRPPPVV